MVKKLRSAITRKSLGKPLSNKNKIKVFVADEPSNILIDGTEEYIDNGNDQDNTVDQGFDNADEEIKESVDEDYEANIVYESDLNNDDVDDEMDHEDESDTEPDSSDDEIEDIHDRMINAIQNFANVKEQKQEDVVKQRSDIVSMNALLNALGDGHGLGAVKQSLTELEKSMNAPTYVDKVISDRMERSIQYESTKKEMGKWHHVVVQNRNARTLDLANDERHKSSYRNLVKTFEPKSKFEKDIQMVLIKCNATDETAEKAEVDQLKGKDMDMDEIRQKQAELAKVRALLFYEQMKRHRINKIKSKAYHRIRKRQRQRKEQGNEETNTDSDHDEEEKELNEKKLLKRIEERMSLRHKNTSKWSKMALEHGKGDKSLR
jgi:U3 small nucleolar RNA-associated protein 14